MAATNQTNMHIPGTVSAKSGRAPCLLVCLSVRDDTPFKMGKG